MLPWQRLTEVLLLPQRSRPRRRERSPSGLAHAAATFKRIIRTLLGRMKPSWRARVLPTTQVVLGVISAVFNRGDGVQGPLVVRGRRVLS